MGLCCQYKLERDVLLSEVSNRRDARNRRGLYCCDSLHCGHTRLAIQRRVLCKQGGGHGPRTRCRNRLLEVRYPGERTVTGIDQDTDGGAGAGDKTEGTRWTNWGSWWPHGTAVRNCQ